MDIAIVVSILVFMTISSVWSKKWHTNNRKCKRCDWFKANCYRTNDDFIKLNCYQGLFKTKEQLHKAIDELNSPCRHGIEARSVLVYGERSCPYCRLEKKYGEAIKVINIGNNHNNNRIFGNIGNHPCCSTKYSLVSPTILIDPETGTQYTVAKYNNGLQWIWFGRCENKNAPCYNGGTCYELWDFPTEILVENPGNTPPYIFKEYHYPRQCVCSQ
ncbi:uncharacterized protein [Argopecten irradians]|uniref:uncharacterized protein n=1 Tax=Argopecten irradians TaxID=31199 RepID=UPI00371F5F7B